MSVAEQNKRLMQGIFDELAAGNSRPLIDHLADDVKWTVTGQTPWSKTYEGKSSVLTDLLRELGQRLAGRYRAKASRIIADGEFIVVQARGDATTKAGLPYNNEYCFVYRIENGTIKEVTEYMDTQLVVSALGSIGSYSST